jgi:hypothetical protein
MHHAQLRTVVRLLEELQVTVCTVAAAHLIHDVGDPTIAAETVAVLRHEVGHALRTWTPPRDSYRAVDLRSLTLHDHTLAAPRELAWRAGRDDLVQALAGRDLPGPAASPQ